jgi:hypothetical protein
MFGLFFDPDEGGFKFRCNIGDLPDYNASNPRRYYYSSYVSLPCSKEPTIGPSPASM